MSIAPRVHPDKWVAVLPLCKGRRVLDIGCIGDYRGIEELRTGSHMRLRDVADVVGIDINGPGVEFLNSLGADCRVLNATRVADLLPERFDVVLLGDILEHMPDPASFLLEVRRVLRPEGRVVCTTPNALHYLNTVCMMLHRPVTRRQHTMWFCSQTLRNTFRFAGYSPCDISFLTFWDNLASGWTRRPTRLLRYILERLLFALNPELAPVLLGVFVPDLPVDGQSIEAVFEERWHP